MGRKTKETKGLRINREMIVTDIGSSCVGNMAWETPYIRFQMLDNSKEVIWQSECAEHAMFALRVGQHVTVKAFAYNERLRNVQVKTESGCLYGINGK